MSSIIVLDSSDEDEVPSKKQMLKLPPNASQLTQANKLRQTGTKKLQQQQNDNSNNTSNSNNNSSSYNKNNNSSNNSSNSCNTSSSNTKNNNSSNNSSNISNNSSSNNKNNSNNSSNTNKKQQNIISSNLLSPVTSTISVSKPKASTLPKINAAFTLNPVERYTPTPPKANNLQTSAKTPGPFPVAGPFPTAAAIIPATITAAQQRNRKTPTPPKPAPTTITTGSNTMLLSSILQQNAAAAAAAGDATSLSNLSHLTNMANMFPMIQSVQSIATSAAPPMQLLATPSSMKTPIESLAAIDPLMMHHFNTNRSRTPVDNFKIHLPLKRPNSAVSSPSAANSPHHYSQSSTPATTAAALRSIKRIKPTTLLKNNEEAWQKRQKNISTSSTSSSHFLQYDDLMEVFPPTSPASSSTATASASSSPSPAAHVQSNASPKLQMPQMPKLHPAPNLQQQTHSRSQNTVVRVHTPPTAALTKTQTPPVKDNAVLDLTESPERPRVKVKSSNNVSHSSPPLTPKMPKLAAASNTATSIPNQNGKLATSETQSTKDGTATTENKVEEKEKTPPREPIIPDYEELIKVCRTADPTEDMDKLINKKLIRYYYSVHPDFLRSRGFRKQLRTTIERIIANPDLVYYNLKTIVDELKVRRKSSNVIVTNDETSATATGGSTGNKRTDEQIKKLNKALYIVTKRIEQLEESEVDWDDDDSSYLQVERFKKRACQIYEKICDLTGESKSALRLVRKPIQFNGTSFPQFNRTLQAYVNQTKEFPDYHDVYRMLEHCNGLYSLGLAQFEMKRIAQDAFIKVGKLLQSRRKTDLYETVAHYTANAEDPAEKDASLLAKLSENQKKCKKIGEVIEKFAREQDLTAEELKEARMKKSKSNPENSKDEDVSSENKGDDDEDDDDDEEDDEEDDDDEPAANVVEIEDDVERITNGDITDEDSDEDGKNEAAETVPSDKSTSNIAVTAADLVKKDCDINAKVNSLEKIQAQSGSNNTDGTTTKINKSREIQNRSETEREQTSGSGCGSGGAEDGVSVLKGKDLHSPVKTSAAQIPNGKLMPTMAKTSKPKTIAAVNVSTSATVPTLTATGLKIISVSSLNDSVKIKTNNAIAVSPSSNSPNPSKQRTVAEIVISDEES